MDSATSTYSLVVYIAMEDAYRFSKHHGTTIYYISYRDMYIDGRCVGGNNSRDMH